MSDLIKREDAIKAFQKRWARTINYNGIGEDLALECEEVINNIPSADRPQGEWIEEEYKGRIYGIYRCQYKCFHCGYVPMHRGEPIIPTNRTLRFCPNCGARMLAKDTNVPNKKGADDE